MDLHHICFSVDPYHRRVLRRLRPQYRGEAVIPNYCVFDSNTSAACHETHRARQTTQVAVHISPYWVAYF